MASSRSLKNTLATRRDVVCGTGIAVAGAAVMGTSKAVANEAASDAASYDGYATHSRPAAHSGVHPTPMNSGYTGPDAQPIAPVAVPDAYDAEYDVVIVGSGFGGLTASIMLAQAGKHVVLIDKDGSTGGASRHATWIGVRSGGTPEQEEMGYHWPGDTFNPKEAAEYFEELYSYSIDQNLLLATVEANTDWALWLKDQPGVEVSCTGDSFIDSKVADGTYNSGLSSQDM